MGHSGRLRRYTAMVVHLLLLQLAFASGAGACPFGEIAKPLRHETMPAGTAMDHASGTPASAHQANQPASPAPHHQPGTRCDMACVAASCGANTGCSGTAASSNAAHSGLLASADVRVSVGNAETPRSVSMAPEPPPPRA